MCSTALPPPPPTPITFDDGFVSVAIHKFKHVVSPLYLPDSAKSLELATQPVADRLTSPPTLALAAYSLLLPVDWLVRLYCNNPTAVEYTGACT